MLYSPGQRYATGFLLFIVVMFTPGLSQPNKANASEPCSIGSRHLFGHLETITRIDHKFDTSLPALIDSGSTTSSMDARAITYETVGNNRSWVRFKILTERNGRGKEVTLLKPVKRFIRVLTHHGPPQRRPVIEATIELGSVKTTTEFSLTSRSKFPQSILLGRNTLDDLAVIDTSGKFLLDGCQTDGGIAFRH